ncbi:MAG TPA: O-antigen ligase family protein [Anaerolineales bacterium]|nr:O-antigen ligase family protein [Anaerolineales bacterium]
MDSVRDFARYLARIEIWGVALAVFGSMVVTGLLPWAVLFLAVFWGIRRLAWGRISRQTPVDVPLLILGLIVPFNAWISPLPEKSLPQLYRLLVGMGWFYAIVNGVASNPSNNALQARRWLQWMVWLITLGAVALAFFSLFSVEWAVDKLPFIPPAVYSYASIWVRDTVHPNVMAGTLAILLPIPLGVVLFGGKEMKGLERTVLAGGTLIVAVFMLLTQSRGAMLAMGAAVAVLVLLRWRRGWMGVSAGAIVTLGLIWEVGLTRVLDAMLVSATLNGANGRFQIWRRALYMIQDFPLTGVGMGLFGDVADALYPFVGVEPGVIPHAHQLFLQIAVDLGVPGLIAWFAVFVIVSVAAWQVYRAAQQKEDRWLMGLGTGLLASQVALIVHGLLDAVTWGMVRSAPIVWGIWGLVIATYMRRRL